jgi:sodium-dependent dicarboxylate transporter 2/3/5
MSGPGQQYDPDEADDLEDHAIRAAPAAERMHRLVAIFVVPALAAAAYLLVPAGDLGHAGRATMAMALWMAGWWVTEAIPLAATALLPVALFPLLGITTIQEASAPYSHKLIFLFLGGFMMAQAMERWNLHRRLALLTVRALGTSPRRLVAGFMLAVAFLSMWVSNTATVIMMIPTGLSVVDLVSAHLGEDDAEDAELFAAALLLGIAYAASIGGVGTLIGTPPNALFAAFVEREYQTQFPFSTWAALGIPVVVGFLPVAWLCLTRLAFPFRLEEIPGGREVLDAEYEALGPIKRAEKIVLAVFSVAALAWITRPLLQSAGLAGLDDSSIAVLGALALFVCPAGTEDGERVLTWGVARHLPWGILLLFGGGLSLAAAMSKTGVAPLGADDGHGRDGRAAHRVHLEHRHHGGAPPRARGRGQGCRGPPLPADAAGGDGGELRLHAARGHRPQRHRHGLGESHAQADDARRDAPQPAGHRVDLGGRRIIKKGGAGDRPDGLSGQLVTGR